MHGLGVAPAGVAQKEAKYSQEGRIIAVETSLGEDVLLLNRLSGSEGVSRLFSFQLEMLSEKAAIDFTQLIGHCVTVRIRLANGQQRFINGLVKQFVQSGRDNRFAHYDAEIVPWLWFLTLNQTCRIFQHKTVMEIITGLFDHHGIKDYLDQTQGTYERREYCVQYRETDFAFVSRLMEEYGIFYYFKHEPTKHMLVMADASSAHKPCLVQPSARFESMGRVLGEECVTHFEVVQTVRSGAYALTDYNFETPFVALHAEEPTVAKLFNNANAEIFDYPGGYMTKTLGQNVARLRMQQEEVEHIVVRGASTCGGFVPGCHFDLQEHYRKDLNKSYLITEVQHSANCGAAYYTREAEETDTYENEFRCIPYSVPYRPLRCTPCPTVKGPQTAVVVGPSGEEIYTDKYGRVKVQFFWDREGRSDENSSCWIRVSQNWAGKGWGAMSIPRIGQEVIVDFLEGDPDRPIITGRVYNAEQMPPYALPDNQTRSTLKSLSSKGGGGFNEIRLEDKKGDEQIFFHGEKDMDMRIKNDRREWIGRDRHLIVKRDKRQKVERDSHLLVQRDQISAIVRDRHLDISGKQAIRVGGSHSFTVTGDVIEGFAANHSEHVKRSYYLNALELVLEAATGLTIKVGNSYVNIDPSGIQISGPMVMINSGGSPLSGSPATPAPPLNPTEPEIADNALPGSESPSFRSQRAQLSPAQAAAADAPWHDAHSAENQTKKNWIAIRLRDERGDPVPGEFYRITLPDGSTLCEGTLDEKGFARVEGIDPGTCKVSFPRLDRDAWKPQ